MDKREKILKAALHLFVEFGFHGTPTSKIANKAGVANGTLFHYFATKEALIIALYIDIKQQMGCFIAENTTGEAAFKETIKKQYLASLFWALENKTQFRFMEQFNSSPFSSLIKSEEIEEQIKPYLDILNQGIAENIIKPIPLDMLFALINSHVYGINHYLITNQFPKTKEHQLINNSFDLLWKMIT